MTLTKHSKTMTLAGLIILSLGAGNEAKAQVPPPSGSRLRAISGNLLIGYASRDNFGSLPDAAQYAATASAEFNLLTPENQLKFDATEPSRNTFNFAPGDAHVAFAQAHGMTMKGHNLVWHQQVPAWVTNGNFNAATLTSIMQNHIANVVGHYQGKIAIWDVVNEAFNDDGSRAASIWQNIGNNHIELAFQAAHNADMAAILNYNDFNIETVNTKSNAVLAMVQDFKRRGIPINGVGFEMHLTSGGIDINSLTTNMQRFAAAGVNIYISEMDVREPVPASAAALQSQATIYSNVLKACLAQPACKAFQMWGFTDKYSWIPGTFAGMGQALPFDENYAAKPAYFAIQTALGGTGGTPNFTISATPANVSVTQGMTATSRIAVAPTGGFTGSVTFSATGLPTGVTPSFSPASSTTASTLTFNASNAAAVGPASVTITGTSGTLSHTTPISLMVVSSGGGGGGTGGVVLTPVINSNGPWFDDQGVRLSNPATITALSLTITIQNTGGISFSGQYNTVGGSIAMSHGGTGSAITYQFNLSAGQTLSPGTTYLFDAQMGGTGSLHPTAGDTFTATYTTGGTSFTQTGHF